MSTSFHAWSSRDLAWAKVRAWAPAIATMHGKYYYYFSADKNIGVAVSDRPEGPFIDPLERPLVSKADFPGMQCIDPMVFVDDDNSAYLYWGQGRCKAVRLNDDMISFDETRVRDITPRGYNEAPFVHKRKDKYYFSWSEYDTRDPRYSVAYGVSDSPLGPFEKAKTNPILQQRDAVKGAGHHSIMQIPGRDAWIIAYHRFRIPGGNGYNRETCLSPLFHDTDGRILPVNVFATVPPVRVPGSPPDHP
jgi:beta-xylosidase